MNPPPAAEPDNIARAGPVESRGVERTDAPLAAWEEIGRALSECESYSALRRLAVRADSLARTRGYPPGQVPLRVALLVGGDGQFLRDPVQLALTTAGYAPQIFVAPYRQTTQQLLDENSETARFRPELVIVLNTTHDVPEWPELDATVERANACARRVCEALLAPCLRMQERLGCAFVLHSFAPPATRVQGNAAARLPGDPINFVRRLNVLLGDLAPPSVQLLDVAGLVEEHGMTRWFDPRYWYLAKQPIAFAALPAYVRSLAGLARARHGRSRKCVVVDLDNTLWGGVVADDGVAGIELGEGSPTGEAFRAFQRYLRELKRRGVLLAVCSKNDEDVARLPFERHPDMLLRTDDFVAFKANWAAKSQNLAAIADELGLPTDSLVFVDDNPAERDEVRRAGLGVWVVELSDDPSQFPALIERDRLFDASVLSAEDLDRTEAYRGRARAEHRRSSATDLNAFLRSLEMHARVEPIAPESAARVEQLLNKTNQFNLTGRRVTAAEIERVMKAPGWLARTLRVWDRFADHGLISVVYGEVLGTVLEIENWVTSCRVLDRGCEALLLSELLRDARERGVKTIRGTYRPTERNARVRELFPSLGFEPIDDTGGVTRWSLPVAAHVPRPTWITLVIGP